MQVQDFLGLPYFDYETVYDRLMHEFQEGSQYERVGGAFVQRLATLMEPHNHLLGVALGTDIPWTRQLEAANFVLPV